MPVCCPPRPTDCALLDRRRHRLGVVLRGIRGRDRAPHRGRLEVADRVHDRGQWLLVLLHGLLPQTAGPVRASQVEARGGTVRRRRLPAGRPILLPVDELTNRRLVPAAARRQ